MFGTTKATGIESDDMSLIGGFANVHSGGNNDVDACASSMDKFGKSKPS
jgi:hypothetical protein